MIVIKFVVLAIMFLGFLFLTSTFPALTQPAFHVMGTGVSYGILGFCAVGLVVLRRIK